MIPWSATGRVFGMPNTPEAVRWTPTGTVPRTAPQDRLAPARSWIAFVTASSFLRLGIFRNMECSACRTLRVAIPSDRGPERGQARSRRFGPTPHRPSGRTTCKMFGMPNKRQRHRRSNRDFGRPALVVGRRVFHDSPSRVQAIHVRPTRVPCRNRVWHAEHFEHGAGSLGPWDLAHPHRIPAMRVPRCREGELR